MNGHTSKYSGVEIDENLSKVAGEEIVVNGFIKLESSIEAPVDLNTLKASGNFSIQNWTNGPNIANEDKPSSVNISIMTDSTKLYQSLTYRNIVYVRSRLISSDITSFTEWSYISGDGVFSFSETAPTNPSEGELWFDSSNDSLIIKIYKNGEWISLADEVLMAKSIYDKNNKNTDIYDYIDNAVSGIDVDGEAAKLNAHIADTSIHVTSEEKAEWNNSASKDEVTLQINALAPSITTEVENAATEFEGKTDQLLSDITELDATIDTHITNNTIHPSVEKQAYWDSKAAGLHTHIDNGTVQISGEDITSGTINIDRIDQAAIARTIEVADDDALLALTIDDVQNGDSVYVLSTKSYYVVVDDTRLGESSKPVAAYNSYYDVPVVVDFVYSNAVWVMAILGNDYTYTRHADGIELRGTFTSNITSINKRSAIYLNDNTQILIVNDTSVIKWTSPSEYTYTENCIPVEITDIVYDSTNGVIIGIADDSNLYTSTDGTTWNTVSASSASSRIFSGISYANNIIYGTYTDSTIYSMITLNGTSSYDETVSSYPDSISVVSGKILYGNNIYLLYSKNIATNKDIYYGAVMTSLSTSTFPDTINVEPIYNTANNVFMALGIGTSNTLGFVNYILYTQDFTRWESNVLPNSSSGDVECVSINNGTVVYLAPSSLVNGANLENGFILYSRYTYTDATFLNILLSMRFDITPPAFKIFGVGASELSWDLITGKPTTIAGYGITDAYTKDEVDEKYAVIEADITKIEEELALIEEMNIDDKTSLVEIEPIMKFMSDVSIVVNKLK